jgi:hypothetical protein
MAYARTAKGARKRTALKAALVRAGYVPGKHFQPDDPMDRLQQLYRRTYGRNFIYAGS